MLYSVFNTQETFYINEEQELQEHKQETKGDSQHMGTRERTTLANKEHSSTTSKMNNQPDPKFKWT